MKKKNIIILIIIALLLLATLVAYFKFFYNNKVIISFNSDGIDKIPNYQVEKGEEVNLPEPKKEGFVFDGWYLGETKINSPAKFEKDTVLTAKWKEDVSSIVVHLDYGYDNHIETMQFNNGDKLQLPTNLSRDDYKFLYWVDKEDKEVILGTILDGKENEITYTAKWSKVEQPKTETPKTETKKTYTVTFDTNGGSKISPIVVNEDSTLKLPANPTKEGYNFIRWEDKNAMPIYDGAKLACEDITLYAVWQDEASVVPED